MRAFEKKTIKLQLTKEESEAITTLWSLFLTGALADIGMEDMLLLLEAIYNGYGKAKMNGGVEIEIDVK